MPTREKPLKLIGLKKVKKPQVNHNPKAIREAVVAYARMNPPTIGHQRLVETVIDKANETGGEAMVFLSSSHDQKKNPLSFDEKFTLALEAFGDVIKPNEHRDFFSVLQDLGEDGYDRVYVVVGEDRFDEMCSKFEKYNGVVFDIPELYVMSAGHRDPDADGVDGISGTKLREAAAAGDLSAFRMGLPSKLQPICENVMSLVRDGMGLEERNDQTTTHAKLVDHGDKYLSYLGRSGEKREQALNSRHSRDALLKVADKYKRKADRHLQAATVATHMLDKRQLSVAAEETLERKAAEHSVDIEILKEVYFRGCDAYVDGKLTVEQHAFGRVNSFLKGGLAAKLDADLYEKVGKIDWDKHTNHGWWKNSKDHVTVYHGTHDRNVENILHHGLTHKDPKTGMISVTMDPHTAHGYASMSGSGGERNFREAGSKAVHTPEHERSVVKMHIPKSWLDQHMDHEYHGNTSMYKDKIRDQAHYDKWKSENPHLSDHHYYSLTEFRLKKEIPSHFIAGVMKKKENPQVSIKENQEDFVEFSVENASDVTVESWRVFNDELLNEINGKGSIDAAFKSAKAVWLKDTRPSNTKRVDRASALQLAAKYGRDNSIRKKAMVRSAAIREASYPEDLEESAITGNPGYGYHGTRPKETADKDFSAAHTKVKRVVSSAGHLSDVKKPNVMVKHYLDSTHGRHLGNIGVHDEKYISSSFKSFKKTYNPEHFNEEVGKIKATLLERAKTLKIDK